VHPPRAPVDASLILDGLTEPSETLWSRGSSNVMVIETAIPTARLALTLTSAYLGVPGADTLVTHGLAARCASPRTWFRRVPEGQLASTSPTASFVLDHLAQLQDHLSEIGVDARWSLCDGAADGSPNSSR
jgi:hypothetical protein